MRIANLSLAVLQNFSKRAVQNTWGAFKYDESKDVTRLDVPVLKQTEALESLAMYFEKSAGGAYLVMVWDAVRVNLPITF